MNSQDRIATGCAIALAVFIIAVSLSLIGLAVIGI